MTTYYITKWALTKGILTVEDPDFFEGYLTDHRGLFVGDKDYFDNLDAAQARVKSLAEAKLRTLEKSTKKMKAMEKNGTVVKPYYKDGEKPEKPKPDGFMTGILNRDGEK